MTGSIMAQHFDWKFGSRYYYNVVATAPQVYPVSLHTSALQLSDKRFEEVTYSSSSKWGFINLTATGKKKHLPVMLDLQYDAYREQRFYSDTIPFHGKKLDSIFKTFLKTDNSYSFSEDERRVQGLNFVIGIANHGNIIIWIQGKDKQVELLRHHIKWTPEMNVMHYPLDKIERQAFFDDMFKELSPATKLKIKADTDTKANYIDTPSLYRPER